MPHPSENTTIPTVRLLAKKTAPGSSELMVWHWEASELVPATKAGSIRLKKACFILKLELEFAYVNFRLGGFLSVQLCWDELIPWSRFCQ